MPDKSLQYNTVKVRVEVADIHSTQPGGLRVSLLDNTVHRATNHALADTATFHGVRAGRTEVVVTSRGLVVGRKEVTIPAAGELAITVPIGPVTYEVTEIDGAPCRSEPAQALAWIKTHCEGIPQSKHFVHVKPAEFVELLKQRVQDPDGIHQGNTNFCWAAAAMSTTIKKDPLGFTEMMVGLYNEGKGEYRCSDAVVTLKPCPDVRNAVGTGTFDDDKSLVHQTVDQMMFMSLADHYKNYFNTLRHRYRPGDEGTARWAGGTLGKFRRVMKDFGHSFTTRGSDMLFVHRFKAKAVQDELAAGRDVMLFINSGFFFGKDKPLYEKISGTHWIRVRKVELIGDEYSVDLWDYGEWQTWCVTPRRFQQGVYGIVSAQR